MKTSFILRYHVLIVIECDLHRNEIMNDGVSIRSSDCWHTNSPISWVSYLDIVMPGMYSYAECAACVHRWSRDSNVINHHIHKLDPTLELHWYLETFSLEMVSFYCRGQPSFNVTVTITHLIYFLFSDKCCSCWIKWKSFYEIALMFTECADTDVWGRGRCG